MANLHKLTLEKLAARVDEFLFDPPENRKGEEEKTTPSTSSQNQLLAEDLFKCMNEMYDAEEALDSFSKDGRVNALRECVAKIQNVVEKNKQCKEVIEELTSNYQSITERTSSLHHACDRIMANQTQLAAGAEQIKANLYYYTQCDWIMKKLTSSRLPITGQSFTQILSTIHECICYLKEHPDHKEAVAYLGKYEQCLSKALTAIRIGIHSDIENSKQAVLSRQKDDSNGAKNGSSFPFTSDDSHALLYGVFAARANNVRNALTVSDRFFSSYTEYQVMVNECEQDYFAVREELLAPVVQATVDQLVQTHGQSSCTLTRSGCKFLLRLCDDEYRLYKQFFVIASENSEDGTESVSRVSRKFSTNSEVASTIMSNPESTPSSIVFTGFIENICKILYDVLRPLIIHNPHLETLAQLCTILKVEMIEDHCGVMMSMGSMTSNAIDSCAGFVRVMSDLIGDIIMRIVYKASTFAETDILGYKPVSGDLNYPERLYQMKDIEMQQRKETSTEVDLTSPSAINAHCLWYPTVRRTVMCLSKLYKCLDVTVFQSIAKELLTACCDSLDVAAVGIASRPATEKSKLKMLNRALDAKLFVVKHLLILREQTSPFRVTLPTSKMHKLARLDSQQFDNVPMVDYAFDLSKFRTSASQLFMENRDRWFELSSNNAFLEFIFATPVQATESSIDSRRVVEVQLKKHCHELIQLVVDMIIGPLKSASLAIAALVPDDPVDVAKHEFLSPQAVQNASAMTFKTITKSWHEIRGSFDLYIGVKETEEILLHPVRKQIVDSYSSLNVFIAKFFSEEQRQVAGVPSQEQVFLALNV
ncbi:hypothetical protein L596_008845 [Steinernema carpocapsae]|uniref:Conserved oligomeric Golgi complex subunit 3 n=1 Tax=Steinernema carpocapsae TaxID=34508 RepID=A0A4U5PDX1_STECR|nr:hypothetical protein L596_008845 [Steinernema carpocapsae]